MHNCKLITNSFIDLALDEIPPPRSTELLAELNGCPVCRKEFEGLRSTLHMSDRALQSALPNEEFWVGYRSRLHSRLQVERVAPSASPTSVISQMWLALKTIATSSVHVPVPVALALVLLFGGFLLVMRTLRAANAPQSIPVVLAEPRHVEAPIIQEKVITRVVYVEKKGRTFKSDVKRSGAPVDSSLATTGSNSAIRTALNLSGFKPTDEVKLTVIKGGYKDQKR